MICVFVAVFALHSLSLCAGPASEYLTRITFVPVFGCHAFLLCWYCHRLVCALSYCWSGPANAIYVLCGRRLICSRVQAFDEIHVPGIFYWAVTV